MHGVQMVGLAHHLTRQPTGLFVQHANLAPDHRLLRRALLVGDQRLQALQPRIGDFGRNGGLFGGRRAGAGGILEAEGRAEAHGADQVQRRLEIRLRLAREARR